MRTLRILGIVLAMAGGMATTSVARAIVAPAPLPRPVPPPGWAYRWVPAQYQTITERFWVAERRELVPEWREVFVPYHHYEQVWREVLTPAHWETTTRQVQISPGHWELVRVDPPMIVPRPTPMPRPVWTPGTVGVEGYQPGTPVEDLSPFTPLREWPK